MKAISLFFASFFLTLGCRTESRDQGSVKADSGLAATQQLEGPTCAAIRGNGEAIYGHFGSLAKIIETFGVLQGVAGGSSGAITSFLYEGMYNSPFVREDCASGQCTDADPATAQRLALLFKSLLGYKEVLAETEPFKSTRSLIAAFGEIRSLLPEVKNLNDFKTAMNDPNSAIRTLSGMATAKKAASSAENDIGNILHNSFARELINEDLISFLEKADTDFPIGSTKDVSTYFNELKVAISTLGNFDGTDSRVFFRRGLINFSGLAGNLGRIANFYAGYGHKEIGGSNTPTDQDQVTWFSNMKKFVQLCSVDTVGLAWDVIRSKAVDGSTCGAIFKVAASSYNTMLEKAVKSNRGSLEILETNFRQRLDESVGKFGKDLITIATTSYMKAGSGIHKNFLNGKKFYKQHPDEKIPDTVFGLAANEKFFADEVRFAYWTSPDVRDEIQKNGGARAPSLKISKRDLIINTTWRTVLTLSPAEPGLAPAQEFPGDPSKVSTGGWNDLHPVQILKDAGCKRVIYVTRTEPETVFGRQVAVHLGMTPKVERELFALGENIRSGFNDAINEADVVWCTRWNSFKIKKTPNFFETIFNDGYNEAQYEVHGDHNGGLIELATAGNSPSSKQFRAGGSAPNGVNLVGCTPGVADIPGTQPPVDPATIQPIP